MPVMVPIMLPRPRLMSMKKNMTDQNGDAGKWVMASVKAMKARPVPWTAYRETVRGLKSGKGRSQILNRLWILYVFRKLCQRLTLLSSSSRTQGSRPSWAKLPSLTVLMTPYISA